MTSAATAAGVMGLDVRKKHEVVVGNTICKHNKLAAAQAASTLQ